MSTPDTAQRIAGEAARKIADYHHEIYWEGVSDHDPQAIILRAADSIMLARLEQWGVGEALQLANLNYTRTNHSQPDLMGDDEFEAWTAVRAALAHLDALRKGQGGDSGRSTA